MTNILSVLGSSKSLIIAVTFGLIVGYVTGWYQKSESVHKQVEKATKAIRVQDAKQVIEVQKKDNKLDEKKAELEIKKIYITKEVIKYVPKTVIQTVQNDVACPSPTLSVHAVGLLNEARTGEIADSAGLSDAEKQTSTEIGLQELSVADTELAIMYRELAANHDALVDGVAEYQKQQLEDLK